MVRARLGHAHLKVKDLERSIGFYTKMFSLTVTERVGSDYAFLSGGSLHHEIALQGVGASAPKPPAHSTGLYHVAFEVPDRRALAEAYERLRAAGIAVTPVDHFISWALYFDDPDGNGLEIYWDTRHEKHGRKQWRGESAPLSASQLLTGSGEEP
jgi:catechol 2,3-dioxygenase